MRCKIKHLIVSFTLLLGLSPSINATSVLASSFGWNGVDDTQSLYDAFTSNVDTLIVDLQAGNWVSGPLIFNNTVNDKVVIFEKGVKIIALSGAYDAYLYDGLLNFTNCSNVLLKGYGATLQMNKQEYINLNDGSEWRHVISLSGCHNFKIYGFELLDSGGDGIEISGIWQQPVPSTNIHIKNCKIDNNYRQGISITSAENVLIEHCLITNTNGTPPAYGIDIEPDEAYDKLNNIEIQHCRITGNEGGGILISLWQLNQTTEPISINIIDTYIGSNQNQGINIDVNSSGPVSGSVNIERCFIENQPGNAIFSNKRESLSINFSDIVIRNVGTNAGSYDMPIFIQKQFDYFGFVIGNITFNNIFIDDHLFNRDFLDISHWGLFSHIENITGNFSVYNPNGVSYYIENPSTNINITTNQILSLPVAQVFITTNNDTAYETGNDTTASFTITRTTPDNTFPLGISFDITGSATNRLDYDYFTKFILIPHNQNEATHTIQAIKDTETEPVEDILVSIQSDTHYTIQNQSTQLFINDEFLTTKDFNPYTIFIYPNPVNTILNINTKNNLLKEVIILNHLGQKVKASKKNRVDISGLNSGIYLIKIKLQNDKLRTFKFIKE